MRLPTDRLRKAAVRRMRPEAGPSEVPQAPAPKRLVVRAPQPRALPEISAAPEVDLTGDSPPAWIGQAAGEPQEAAEPSPAEAEQGREIEPPADAALPPEDTSEGSPPRPAPEQAEVRRSETAAGSSSRPTQPPGSAPRDGRWAERLAAQVIVPEVQEEMSQLGTATFYREAYAASIRLINSLAATRGALSDSKALLEEARRDAEEAGKALEEARAEHAAKIAEVEQRAETEAGRAGAALSQYMQAESLAAARGHRIDELETALQSAEAKARDAEEAGNRAISRSEELEAKVRELAAAADGVAPAEARAAAAEARAEKAEARAVTAVEEFRASDTFVEELIESSADAYVQGFRDAREKVARVLDLPHVRDIEPDQGPGEAFADGGPAADA